MVEPSALQYSEEFKTIQSDFHVAPTILTKEICTDSIITENNARSVTLISWKILLGVQFMMIMVIDRFIVLSKIINF
jgi:hypothetical protein